MQAFHLQGRFYMYAVIATGGKQYRVEKNGTLRVELLDAEAGSTVEFNEVLMVADGANVRIGAPLLAGAAAAAGLPAGSLLHHRLLHGHGRHCTASSSR